MSNFIMIHNTTKRMTDQLVTKASTVNIRITSVISALDKWDEWCYEWGVFSYITHRARYPYTIIVINIRRKRGRRDGHANSVDLSFIRGEI